MLWLPSNFKNSQHAYSKSVQFVSNAAIVLPFFVVITMSFIAVGWLESTVFRLDAYIITAIMLIALALMRAFCRSTRGLELLLLIGYLATGAALLLFIAGFNTPFTILWIAIMLGAYVRFNLAGFVLASISLIATAVAFAMLSATPSITFYITSSFYTIFIIIMGYILIKIMQFDVIAEEQLEQTRSQETVQRDRLDTLLNSIAEGVLTVDTKGVVKLQNAAILALLDTNDSTIGKQLDDILNLVDENNTPVKAQSLLQNITSVVMRTDLSHHFEGLDLLRLSIQITPIRTSFRGFGEPGFVLILRDITKEKTLEEERDEFINAQWTIARGCAALAIEKCKNATGQRRTIDLYVSANQCAEDIFTAIEKAKVTPC